MAQETSPAAPPQPEDKRLALIQAAEAAAARAATAPQPIPEKLPLITRSSSYGEWHAFCIQLPKGPALVMPTSSLVTSQPTFNGSPLKLGSLLRYSKGGFGRFWVWEIAPGPATVGAPLRRSASLPLLREEDELVIVTKAGHCSAVIEKDWFLNTELLPSEPFPIRSMALVQRPGYSNITCGDPVFHKRTGELIGAVTYISSDSIPTELPKVEVIYLDFPTPPQAPQPPLTHLWGIPVKPSPADREIFTRVLPKHVTQDRLGEELALVWARNPYLSRRPDRGISSESAAGESLPDHFMLKTRSVHIKNKQVSELSYYGFESLQKREMAMLMRWLVEKFAEPQTFEIPRRQWMMAAWDFQGSTLSLEFDYDDSPSIKLHLRSCKIADIRRHYTSAMVSKPGGSPLLLQAIDSVPEPPKEDPFKPTR